MGVPQASSFVVFLIRRDVGGSHAAANRIQKYVFGVRV
jgi:hypothetical protein